METSILKAKTTRKVSNHGQSYTPEYKAWTGLVNRCTRPTDPAWENYGGRGITVSDEWREDFFAFLADMGRRPSPSHEIDRRNNEEGYNRNNCRWVDRKTNSRNRRNNYIVHWRGRDMCLTEACELEGLPISTVGKRLSAPLNWSLEKALTTPVRPKARKGEGKKPPPLTNKTGYLGVKARRKGFTGRVVVNGKRLQSRQFKTPEEAHQWCLDKKQIA